MEQPFAGDEVEVGEERLDKLVELLTGGRQGERPPLEQRHPQVFIQLRWTLLQTTVRHTVIRLRSRGRMSCEPRSRDGASPE